MAQYTNTVLPALAMVGDFLTQRAKKKVTSDLSTNLINRIQGAMSTEDLALAMQESQQKLYANTYIDPEQQARVGQVLNQAGNYKEVVLNKKNMQDKANKLYQIQYDAVKDSEFEYNGKLLTGKGIADQLANIADPEIKVAAFVNLTDPKNIAKTNRSITNTDGKYQLNESITGSSGKVFQTSSYDISNYGNKPYIEMNKEEGYQEGIDRNLTAEEAGYLTTSQKAERDRLAQERRLDNQERNANLQTQIMRMREIRDQRSFDNANKKEDIINVTNNETGKQEQLLIVNSGQVDGNYQRKIYKFGNDGRAIEVNQNEIENNYTVSYIPTADDKVYVQKYSKDIDKALASISNNVDVIDSDWSMTDTDTENKFTEFRKNYPAPTAANAIQIYDMLTVDGTIDRKYLGTEVEKQYEGLKKYLIATNQINRDGSVRTVSTKKEQSKPQPNIPDSPLKQNTNGNKEIDLGYTVKTNPANTSKEVSSSLLEYFPKAKDSELTKLGNNFNQ